MSVNILTNPYKLAESGLVAYCGDIHPLGHDGAWIDTSTWESDGYASCVRVTVLLDGPDACRHLYVERLVINRLDMGEVLASCGVEGEASALCQAECCLLYGHYDPDGSDWTKPHTASFLLLDDGENPDDFARYARIHNSAIATEDAVWQLLAAWVGRELYNGR